MQICASSTQNMVYVKTGATQWKYDSCGGM